MRPEFVRLVRKEEAGEHGLPVTLKRIEDVGRFRIARTEFFGREINVVVPEGVAVSEHANRILFDARHVNVYADGWIVEGEAA